MDYTRAVVDLKQQKTDLIAYMQSKTKAGDWHACADCAMDLRELEAKIAVYESLIANAH